MSGGLRHRGEPLAGTATRRGDGSISVSLGDEAMTFETTARPDGSWILRDGSRQHEIHVARHRGVTWVHAEGRTWRFEEQATGGTGAAGGTAAGDGRLVAPMPATVLEVRVAIGDHVAEGATIAVISAMKMQIDVTAPSAGAVVELPVSVGSSLDAGALIARVEAAADEAS